MAKFFIDTADANYIEKLWPLLNKNGIKASDLVGITTNPNAFTKEGLFTLDEWADRTRVLCDLVGSIRQDGDGIVFIQIPNSRATNEEYFRFIRYIVGWGTDGAMTGLKIPPYTRVLEYLHGQIMCELNVTGIADADTALECLSYDVDYVSLIPGRMEAEGIKAWDHMRYILSAYPNGSYLIAGSMRKMQDVADSIAIGAVPTIGKTVWDAARKCPKDIKNNMAKITRIEQKPIDRAPKATTTSSLVTVSFFEEMDRLGSIAYEELQNAPNK